MRILVLGAFGYLGSRVSRWLVDQGDEVIAAGRKLPDPLPEWTNGVLVHAIDVKDAASLTERMREVDYVVQLASLDPLMSRSHPLEAFEVSGLGTRAVLKASHQAGVRRVVFASTLNVYGPRASGTIDEGTRPWPTDPYTVAHLAGEGFCFEINQHLERPFAAVLRLANTYGASLDGRDRSAPVHNDLCRQVGRLGRIELATPGLACRDFVWVEDVAQGIRLVLTASDAELPEPLFNLAGGVSMTIIEFAQQVAEIASKKLGKAIPIERPNAQEGAVATRFKVSLDRFSGIGYRPSNQIKSETERMIETLVS